jgi:flagellar biosynthesis protein FlhG
METNGNEPEPSLYEILDVAENASGEEIERAYHIAAATYQPGSAAAYSVFSDDESAEILRQVERAFSVLSDPRKRRDYDIHRRTPASRAAQVRESNAPAPASAAPALAPAVEHRPRPAPADPRPDIETPVPEDGIYDGKILHRIRVSRGIELEEIAAVTKINQQFLRHIESDRYELLPAPVYVKGFVREIARVLRLDPARVSESYMQRYREKRGMS